MAPQAVPCETHTQCLVDLLSLEALWGKQTHKLVTGLNGRMKQVQWHGEDKTMGRQWINKKIVLGRQINEKGKERNGRSRWRKWKDNCPCETPASPALAHPHLSTMLLPRFHVRGLYADRFLGLSLRTVRHRVKPHNSPKATLTLRNNFSLHPGCCHYLQ